MSWIACNNSRLASGGFSHIPLHPEAGVFAGYELEDSNYTRGALWGDVTELTVPNDPKEICPYSSVPVSAIYLDNISVCLHRSKEMFYYAFYLTRKTNLY